MVTSARARGVVKERDVEGVCDDGDDDDKGHRDRGIQPMLIALLVSGLFHTLLPIPDRHALSISHLPRRGSPFKFEGHAIWHSESCALVVLESRA